MTHTRSPATGVHGRHEPLGTPAPRREPLWRNVIGDVLRRERLAQERTLKEVSEAARISMPYLSEVERGLKEASSEVLAAAAASLGMRLIDLLEQAHRELTRQTVQADLDQLARRRPTAFITTRGLSSGSPQAPPEDDPHAVTQVTSVVEVSSRHTDLTGDAAPTTVAGLTSGSVELAA
ncbi:MAG: helix-turn-helix transcriptional regulator [Lapillicoccus sp.]